MSFRAWMPLYWGDLLADTLSLNRADFGSYMLLIGAYWRNGGPLPDDDLALATAARVPDSEWGTTRPRLARFFQVESGEWRHKRIDVELANAQAIVEKRRISGKAGGLAKGKQMLSKCLANATANEEANSWQNATQSQSPIAVESTADGAARPTWEEVKAFADRIGLAEWKAKDWLDEMLAVGWKDWNHRPVLNWQPMLTRVKTKWEADGRPAGPPAAKGSQHGYSKTSVATNRNSGTTNDGKTGGYSAAAARMFANGAVSGAKPPATPTDA